MPETMKNLATNLRRQMLEDRNLTLDHWIEIMDFSIQKNEEKREFENISADFEEEIRNFYIPRREGTS